MDHGQDVRMHLSGSLKKCQGRQGSEVRRISVKPEIVLADYAVHDASVALPTHWRVISD